jgi:pimeloyl-ACP methyl ester carboxylesterase
VGLAVGARGPEFANQWPQVRTLNVPTLLIRAERGLVPKSIATAMSDSNPLIVAVDIANAGHSVRADQPVAVYGAFDAFLRRHSAAFSR